MKIRCLHNVTGTTKYITWIYINMSSERCTLPTCNSSFRRTSPDVCIPYLNNTTERNGKSGTTYV